MKASEAAKAAEAALQPQGENVQPFMKAIFDQVKKEAEKGNFETSIDLPICLGYRGAARWSPSIQKAVQQALEELGYSVKAVGSTRMSQGYGGDYYSSGYTLWQISWAPEEPKKKFGVEC